MALLGQLVQQQEVKDQVPYSALLHPQVVALAEVVEAVVSRAEVVGQVVVHRGQIALLLLAVQVQQTKVLLVNQEEGKTLVAVAVVLVKQAEQTPQVKVEMVLPLQLLVHQ